MSDPSNRSSYTDAELVQRLIVLEKHGGNRAAAARSMSLAPSSFRTSIQEAKRRKLTHLSKVMTPEARLRVENRVLTQQLEHIQKENLNAAEIRRTIYGLSENIPDPPKWVLRYNKPKSSGVPVAALGDWHWGEIVRKSELEGVNEFNRRIARERVKVLTQTIIDLCFNHMTRPQYPGLVLPLLGDMITGDIHEELAETNDGPVMQSVLEVQDVLAETISHLADKFGQVFVPAVIGNHSRTTRKPRAKNRVFLSYEWNIYQQLERFFIRDKRVRFMIPESSDCLFHVAGHRFLLSHGDTLGVKGGDGIIGSLGPIMRGTMKLGRNQAQIGRDYDTLLIGHWHQAMHLPENGVIVNGTLKGYDEFVHTILRGRYSRPSQSLFFVHPGYGITANWPIYLEKVRSAKDNTVQPWVQWKAAA